MDFETFTNVGLSATDEGGAGSAASPTCTDTFTVSTGTSGTNNYPVICGDNTGQHSKVFHCKLGKQFFLALNRKNENEWQKIEQVPILQF